MACTSAADFLPATALQGGLGLRAYDLGDATCVAMGPSIWSCMRQPCPNVLREVEETMPHDPAHGGHTQAAGCRASCPPGSKVATRLKGGQAHGNPSGDQRAVLEREGRENRLGMGDRHVGVSPVHTMSSTSHPLCMFSAWPGSVLGPIIPLTATGQIKSRS